MTLLDLWIVSFLIIGFYIEYENSKSNKDILRA